MQSADREDIMGTINSLAENGASVMLLSDAYGELAGLCDRVLVMRDNRIAAELTGAQVVSETIRRLCMEDIPLYNGVFI